MRYTHRARAILGVICAVTVCFGGSIEGLAQEAGAPFAGLRFSSKKGGEPKSSVSKPVRGRSELAVGSVKIPSELKPIAERGAKAISSGDWQTARSAYNEMILQAPSNPLAYANLGVAEYQLGNLGEAENYLRKSLDLEPRIAANWMTLGLIQYQGRRLLLAISSLTRAIHEDPQLAQAHMLLGAVTYEYGWVDAAIGELKRVIELEPDHEDAHYNLAKTYLSLKPAKVELGRRHYYRALDLGMGPDAEIESVLRNPAR